MLVLIHKECGGPALDESPVGEVCAIPIDRFPFFCFTCLEEILDASEVRLSQARGISPHPTIKNPALRSRSCERSRAFVIVESPV
jgi:glycosylphosphatidylinositol transamidase (GPIT) subunit GPI8